MKRKAICRYPWEIAREVPKFEGSEIGSGPYILKLEGSKEINVFKSFLLYANKKMPLLELSACFYSLVCVPKNIATACV